jgi:hypothetical protein
MNGDVKNLIGDRGEAIFESVSPAHYDERRRIPNTVLGRDTLA